LVNIGDDLPLAWKTVMAANQFVGTVLIFAFLSGGHTAKDETCGVFLYYYPRQDRLSSCTSQPSLSTVLRALGIEKLT
jgi:Copper type II ascorbate-dependent monooxygenase, C-terminal domain